MTDNLSRKVYSSFLWVLSGRLAGQALTLVIGVLLARALGPRDFGVVAMVTVFIGFTEVFMDLGLGSALVQRKDALPVHFNSAFFLNMALAALLAAGMFLTAPLIASFYGEPQLTQLARALSVVFILHGASVAQEAWMRRNMSFRALTLRKLVASLIGGGVGLALAYSGYGVWSLVVQSLTSGVVGTTLLWVASRWRPRFEASLQALRDLWSYGFNMFLASVAESLAQRVDVLVIGKVFDATQLGLFSKAKTLNRGITQYSSHAIGTVAFPALAGMQDDRERLQHVTLRMIDLVLLSSLALTGALYVTARPLILLLLTEKWIASASIFELLCWSGMFYPISAAQLSIIKALGDSRLFLRLEVVKKVIYFGAIAVGFSFGMTGFLISLIVSASINTAINVRYTSPALGMTLRRQARRALPLFVSMALGILAAKGAAPVVSHLGPLVEGCVSAGVFLVVYLLLGTLLAPAVMSHGLRGTRALLTLGRARSG